MLIHELCKECGLTKKAVNYYLEQGLLEERRGANGYRQFSQNDVARLKEISLLRKLGAGVPEIRRIVTASDKKAALADYGRQLERDMEQMKVRADVLTYWLEHRNAPEDIYRYAARKLDGSLTLKDRLALAFPGNYGLLLSFHFGPFLNEPIETGEQEQAYEAIAAFPDEVEAEGMSPELEQDLQNALQGWSSEMLAQHAEGMQEAFRDYDEFIKANRDKIKVYMEFLRSEEYRQSPAYRMKKRLQAFQEASGYHERFIPNLKILSSSYRNYLNRLEAANERFLSEFPDAKRLE